MFTSQSEFEFGVCRGGQRQAVHHVLNECLVDRGASPAMVTLQVSADRHHITTVQARSPARRPHLHRHVQPTFAA
jgi:NAD kinase